MSTSKVALKAAKAALDAHRYEEAAKEARNALEVDPQNYHASVSKPVKYIVGWADF